jgi:antitoxin ParD1/3/4
MIASTQAAEATMEIALSAPLQDFVRQAVRDGRYASESDVVNAGLQLVEEHDRKLADLRETVNRSLQDTRAVSDAEMDAAILEKSRELLAQGIPW